jgi:hypothetical protein
MRVDVIQDVYDQSRDINDINQGIFETFSSHLSHSESVQYSPDIVENLLNYNGIRDIINLYHGENRPSTSSRVKSNKSQGQENCDYKLKSNGEKKDRDRPSQGYGKTKNKARGNRCSDTSSLSCSDNSSLINEGLSSSLSIDSNENSSVELDESTMDFGHGEESSNKGDIIL